jgi:hypothetical protein
VRFKQVSSLLLRLPFYCLQLVRNKHWREAAQYKGNGSPGPVPLPGWLGMGQHLKHAPDPENSWVEVSGLVGE